MEDIGLYFEYNNQVIQLPVNPEELEVSFDGNSDTSEVIKLGEISILKRKKLGKMTIKSFFPEDTWYPDIRTIGEFKGPEFYRDFFLNIMELGVPCRFIVTGININMLVSVENFKYKHQGGDYEDEYYTLEIKEFRAYGIQTYTYNGSTGTTSTVTTTTRDITKITINTPCKITGPVYNQSDAQIAVKTLSSVAAVVAYIDTEGAAPYLMADSNKSPIGWCKQESLVIL